MLILGLAIMLLCVGFLVAFEPAYFGLNLNFMSIINFIDLPSFIIIIGPLAAVLTATRSFKVFYEGLCEAVFPKAKISEETRSQAVALFRLLSKTAAIAAAISVLICFVNILANMNFEEVGWWVLRLAQNLAVAFISPLYDFLLIVTLFEPVVFILEKGHAGRSKVKPSLQNPKNKAE